MMITEDRIQKYSIFSYADEHAYTIFHDAVTDIQLIYDNLSPDCHEVGMVIYSNDLVADLRMVLDKLTICENMIMNTNAMCHEHMRKDNGTAILVADASRNKLPPGVNILSTVFALQLLLNTTAEQLSHTSMCINYKFASSVYSTIDTLYSLSMLCTKKTRENGIEVAKWLLPPVAIH